MSEVLRERTELAIESQNTARSLRKRGDALRKVGREDAALDAYKSGAAALERSRDLLSAEYTLLIANDGPPPSDAISALHEIVETYGALGGMQLRLGSLDEARSNYSIGASLEERFNLPSTYNRLNAIKCTLLAGHEPLESLTPKLQALAATIERNLRNDKGLSDSGWAWADLGDCLALLGRLDSAGSAYSTFIAKAEIKSPERTLDILEQIAAKMRESGDPAAPRVLAAAATLRSLLSAK